MPCLSLQEVLKDATTDFESLERHAWDGEFFLDIRVDALPSRVWPDAIAVNGADLNSRR